MTAEANYVLSPPQPNRGRPQVEGTAVYVVIDNLHCKGCAQKDCGPTLCDPGRYRSECRYADRNASRQTAGGQRAVAVALCGCGQESPRTPSMRPWPPRKDDHRVGDQSPSQEPRPC